MTSIKHLKNKAISGFSKLNKQEKLDWILNQLFENPKEIFKEFVEYWHSNESRQKVFDEISENTLTNFFLPYSVAPNFSINDRMYVVPMVIEESSVVAAASKAAKFWLDRGGFKAQVLSTTKIGQVHFIWKGDSEKLYEFLPILKQNMTEGTLELTQNMSRRGGGILDIELEDFTSEEAGYYQLKVKFETCDSMGANFINSCLEEFARILSSSIASHTGFSDEERDCQVVMSILSNFTPECIVRSEVSCAVEDLGIVDGMPAEDFASKFARAVRIAEIDVHRATTHNKGIFNGIDAVVLATGNDFRAIEACGHTYAAKDGQYRSLSHCEVKDGIFRFWLDIPLALGTVGGLTSVHPLARRSLEMLNQPSAKQLMEIVASVGLAQNFGAVKSLVTTGIQKGHMKMHLNNILANFKANEVEAEKAKEYFDDKIISFVSVRNFLEDLRQSHLNL